MYYGHDSPGARMAWFQVSNKLYKLFTENWGKKTINVWHHKMAATATALSIAYMCLCLALNNEHWDQGLWDSTCKLMTCEILSPLTGPNH